MRPDPPRDSAPDSAHDSAREDIAAILHDVLRAADRGIETPPGLWTRVRTPPAPALAPHRRRWAVAGAALAVALAVCAITAGTWWLTRPGTAPPPAAAPPALTVYNAEAPCRPLHTQECALRLARDPHAVYAGPDNTAGRVWHGDRLAATCVAVDGTLIEDESGITSTRWYLVTTADGVRGWLPGVRTRNTTEVRTCSPPEVSGPG